jgi:hypothetical protein
LLNERQEIRTQAQKDLIAYKERKAAEKEAREDYQRRMTAQMDEARKERTMIFNPRTEKMEMIKK